MTTKDDGGIVNQKNSVSIEDVITDINVLALQGNDLIASTELKDNGKIIYKQDGIIFTGFEEDFEDKSIVWLRGIQYLIYPIDIMIHKLGLTEVFNNINNHLYVLKMVCGLTINIDLAYINGD